MANDTSAATAARAEGIDCRNALVTKVALFLNYLSRENFQKLLGHFSTRPPASEAEILKVMVARKFLSVHDATGLKKACLNFAKAQEDTRFGSLCIQFEFLTQSNLDLALEEQKRMASVGNNIFLGDLLVNAGMLSERQRKLILQKQQMETGLRDAKPEPVQATFHEINESGVNLYIANDGLSAYLAKTELFSRSSSLEHVKDILENNGIIYGIVPDEQLKEFIGSDAFYTDRFMAAKGLAPIEGKDAEIDYRFEREFLSAGHMDRSGAIDYRDRGEVPHVATDEILAVKTPAQPGREGVNIFGDAVAAPEPVDLAMTCGKGVRLSADGLHAIADRGGFPRINRRGQIAVNDAYFIKGDVDYTTGHIKFEQSVFITGTIKAGFQVEAIDVMARSIDGGTINAKGNVVIQNGVTNAQVSALGNITAGYVHAAELSCMGDVEILKEVVDTKITMEGTFKMLRGKMFSSTLQARGGARIYHVGSDKALPCNIHVGTSQYLDRAMLAIDKDIEAHQKGFETSSVERDRIKTTMEQIEQALAQLRKADPDHPDLTPLLTRHKLLDQKIAALQDKINSFATAMKQSVRDKFDLKRLKEDVPSRPILDVKGKLLARTCIFGAHAKRIISSDIARVRVMEIANKSETGYIEGWEMVTTRL